MQKNKIFHNLYQDSVSLMQLSNTISHLDGIEQASVVMGTPTNFQQLKDAKLDEGINAGPNDLIIVVRGQEEACDKALQLAEEKLMSKPSSQEGGMLTPPKPSSIEMAVSEVPDANLALISVPGDYAAAEAIKALNVGLNVMLFSDNVSADEELMVKQLADQKELLVMGPDCGTAIVNGIPLGFANKVALGEIGIVAASGTGLQEVSCRIDQLGEGVSQALGTGGHDLSEKIGGRSMIRALSLLANDPKTKIIVLISKPPAAAIADKVINAAIAVGKPLVIHFLGDKSNDANSKIIYAQTLADAAQQAVSLLRTGKAEPFVETIAEADKTTLQNAAKVLQADRQYLRGIFAGGTFCFEAQLIAKKQGIDAYSNTPVDGNQLLSDIWHSQKHTIVDMGDDAFTAGKPHPMIDPTLRNERIKQELSDPQTAVLLFDLVLGYGAAEDPSTDLLALIQAAKTQHKDGGPVVIAHVCGTKTDIQDRAKQIEALKQAGVLVADCNAQAALWSSDIIHQCQSRRG